MQLGPLPLFCWVWKCFNPHPSRRTGATGAHISTFSAAQVSILTRPGGRVQRATLGSIAARWQAVSILTRPGGRVQPAHQLPRLDSVLGRFNPHPSRRTGATLVAYNFGAGAAVSILTRPGGRVQPLQTSQVGRAFEFQSSPVPKDGCNGTRCRRGARAGVSILTRPEGRVQRGCGHAACPAGCRVSILTRPEGRVQQVADTNVLLVSDGFNPHPSRRTGATHRPSRRRSRPRLFQSSPVPKDGCNGISAIKFANRMRFNPHPSRRTGATAPAWG